MYFADLPHPGRVHTPGDVTGIADLVYCAKQSDSLRALAYELMPTEAGIERAVVPDSRLPQGRHFGLRLPR